MPDILRIVSNVLPCIFISTAAIITPLLIFRFGPFSGMPFKVEYLRTVPGVLLFSVIVLPHMILLSWSIVAIVKYNRRHKLSFIFGLQRLILAIFVILVVSITHMLYAASPALAFLADRATYHENCRVHLLAPIIKFPCVDNQLLLLPTFGFWIMGWAGSIVGGTLALYYRNVIIRDTPPPGRPVYLSIRIFWLLSHCVLICGDKKYELMLKHDGSAGRNNDLLSRLRSGNGSLVRLVSKQLPKDIAGQTRPKHLLDRWILVGWTTYPEPYMSEGEVYDPLHVAFQEIIDNLGAYDLVSNNCRTFLALALQKTVDVTVFHPISIFLEPFVVRDPSGLRQKMLLLLGQVLLILYQIADDLVSALGDGSETQCPEFLRQRLSMFFVQHSVALDDDETSSDESIEGGSGDSDMSDHR